MSFTAILRKKRGEYFEKIKKNYCNCSSLCISNINDGLQYLTMLVNEKVMIQKGTELKLIPSDDELNKKVEDTISQYKQVYGGEDQYKKALEQYGYTEDSFKEIQRDQAKLNAIYEAMTKDNWWWCKELLWRE